VLAHPFDDKYRTVNMDKDKIKATLGASPPALAVLRLAGFAPSAANYALTGYADVARLAVVRSCIDDFGKAEEGRARDEVRKAKEQEDVEAMRMEQEEFDKQASIVEEEEKAKRDAAAREAMGKCQIRFRRQGKTNAETSVVVKDTTMRDFLATVVDDVDAVTVTCINKKKVISSDDWDQTMEDLDLLPGCTLDITGGEGSPVAAPSASTRKKAMKRGSHSMASVGIYSTRDGKKGELIDGGGGTVYEQVTESESEEGSEESSEESSEADSESEE